MKRSNSGLRAVILAGVTVALLLGQGQRKPPSPAESIKSQFLDVNRRILEMAKDFPGDKYNFRLKPEMRSYGEVLVHVSSGNVYAAKAGKGEKARWDELNPKEYADKASVVALVEKSVADANGVLNGLPDEAFTKSLEPWLGVLEHSAEHYGLLVAYYRANGIVPPESRPKK